LPRCNGDILDFYYVRGLDDLMVGSFGIMEPDVRKCSRILDFRNSVLVVPGLGFSPDGKRIGYGRGYYDRFISHYNGKVVGMCYHQQVKMNIPVEETDENINVLITEQYTRNI
ncbi:MAG: 5-formyltetrahydrofolate cyclo-ligase, partial [Ruminococcaceae bacterium]|nr:5-formyltetrahydrofolate cyclo-ligase [Oscillospiraceae bacterium]